MLKFYYHPISVNARRVWIALLSLDVYPRLQAWLERLAMRESWQQTTPQPEVVEAALPSIRKILERRS